MKKVKHKTTYLKDYKPPSFTIEETFLTIHLHDSKTKVHNRLKIKKCCDDVNELHLQGRDLNLQSVKNNGKLLGRNDYGINDEELILWDVPHEIGLEIETIINPKDNISLNGLYKSDSIFCSQCEPEGFRKITYFLDRPDVMSRITTKIVADKKRYPILLSNGNLKDTGDLEGGMHFALWEDPFKKPSYLYALVAGDLGLVQDRFVTKSGRNIDLRIYVDKGRENLCGHAMASLKRAMKWDEVRFDLEYDLNTYMIVAVDSFNMGAMENKGLNIFNSSCILADPETATDQDFLQTESIIGHEYFHNWTGNRVTCRDWFQLTLKEGLTVFRDQEFSSDMHSQAVQRIQDVRNLRQYQFPEDQGPMSHPIRPESYVEVNNFYTSTVYEKGAEIIRMIHTFLGEEGFQRGMKIYFERHDGMAVRVEEFLEAMSAADNSFDINRFKRWYEEKGTLAICVCVDYDPKTSILKIHIEQLLSEGQRLLYFPLNIGLIGKNGREISANGKNILCIKEKKETFTFEKVSSHPVISLNRNFTAPIIVRRNVSTKDQCHLLAYDSDMFNRFESSEMLGKYAIKNLLRGEEVDEDYLIAFEKLLKNHTLDSALKAIFLSLPREKILHQEFNIIDVEGIFKAKNTLKIMLSKRFQALWENIYENNLCKNGRHFNTENAGMRALKNCALSYLSEFNIALVYKQYQEANNMTDRLSAFFLLCRQNNDFRKKAVEDFYNRYKHQTFVMEKWFRMQALSERPEAFDDIQKLEKSDVYDKRIPNLFRSLVGSFCTNYIHFHHTSGRGYKYAAQCILDIDPLNPQSASGLAQAFEDLKKFPECKQNMMRIHLKNIVRTKGLSKNTFEIINKILL